MLKQPKGRLSEQLGKISKNFVCSYAHSYSYGSSVIFFDHLNGWHCTTVKNEKELHCALTELTVC